MTAVRSPPKSREPPVHGPQPFFEGPKGKQAPLRDEAGQRVARPWSARDTDQNTLKGIIRWQEHECERERHHMQKYLINRHANDDSWGEKKLREAASKRRDWLLETSAQLEKATEEHAHLEQQRPRSAGFPRPKQGPKDAKAPSPREVVARYTPVAAAVAAARKDIERSEAEHRRQYATHVSEMESTSKASARDRSSKQTQLGQQADNLLRRQDTIDHRKSAAAKHVDSHGRSFVAKRNKANDKAEQLQRKIRELRAKKEAAQRQAWLLQAHPPMELTPRWNEILSTDRANKARTMERTATATHPAPPTLPSPRAGLAASRASPRSTARGVG